MIQLQYLHFPQIGQLQHEHYCIVLRTKNSTHGLNETKMSTINILHVFLFFFMDFLGTVYGKEMPNEISDFFLTFFVENKYALIHVILITCPHNVNANPNKILGNLCGSGLGTVVLKRRSCLNLFKEFGYFS